MVRPEFGGSMTGGAAEPKLHFVRYAALLGVVVGFTYLPWIGVLPARGEETRWATVAREMAASGDWVVPRQQGVPFLSRPPLGSWLIAAAAQLRGELDLVAVRLPTVLAVIGTSLLVFWYAAKSLPPRWAFVSGLAFATCAEALHLGRIGETDMVFAALTAGALLGWRGTWREGGPTFTSWSLGYGLAALAALAKGAQGPAYFVGAVLVCLLVERRARWLFDRRHAVGALLFGGILAGWHIPALQRLSSSEVLAFWTGDVALRWEEASLAGWTRHLFSFPLEVAAYFLPWSIALGLLARSGIRRRVFSDPFVRFALLALLAAFPTCWLTPNAQVRYFLPLFPLMAVIAGAAIREAVENAVAFSSVLMRHRWALAAACGLGVAALDVGIRLPVVRASLRDTEEAVAELERAQLIDGELSSIGPVHHRFAFFHRKPIALIPETQAASVREGALFTLSTHRRRLFEPAFPYEVLARIPCDGVIQPKGPVDFVVVGRRLRMTAERESSSKR